MYMVKTALVHHIEDDPVYECKDYVVNNTYDDCVKSEIEVRSKIEIFLLFLISGHVPFFDWLCPYLVHI